MGLPPSRRGRGRFEHLGRLHVGEGPEHLLEFRQVGEAGEPASRPQARAVRRDLHRVDDFAEGGRPGVEMLQARGSCSPSGSRNRCIVYISTIVLEIGVPVANVTPWPGCCSSR